MVILIVCGVADTPDFAKSEWYLYCSFLITPRAFALSAVLLLKWSKTPLKTELQAQKCHPKYFIVAIVLQIGLLGLSELNVLFLEFLGNFGYVETPIELPSMDGFGFFGVLLVVAILPAILEETIFRGVLFSGMRSFGKVGAVLLCGGLFALYHQNPAQTLYQFCCGAAFALIALKSGSIFPTILAHFLNNAAILLLAKLGVESFSSGTTLALLIISALSLVGTIVYLCFFDKGEKWAQEIQTEGAGAKRKQFMLSSLAGIILCALTWLLVLVSGM
jgi:membrane protease YdiL (CAAX protease family)